MVMVLKNVAVVLVEVIFELIDYFVAVAVVVVNKKVVAVVVVNKKVVAVAVVNKKVAIVVVVAFVVAVVGKKVVIVVVAVGLTLISPCALKCFLAGHRWRPQGCADCLSQHSP